MANPIREPTRAPTGVGAPDEYRDVRGERPLTDAELKALSDEALDARIRNLLLEVQTIEAQLGDQNRTDEFGERQSSTAYFEWARRAKYARTFKVAQYRDAKAEAKRRHIAMQEAISKDLRERFADLEGLAAAAAAHKLLLDLSYGGRVRYTQEEWAIIDAFRDILLAAEEVKI